MRTLAQPTRVRIRYKLSVEIRIEYAVNRVMQEPVSNTRLMDVPRFRIGDIEGFVTGMDVLSVLQVLIERADIIGQKIENCFLSILELTFSSAYLPLEEKVILLSRAISKMDSLKFFIQIAWENKLVPTNKYSTLSSQLDEVGRMLGGWRKGLLNKTPAK